MSGDEQQRHPAPAATPDIALPLELTAMEPERIEYAKLGRLTMGADFDGFEELVRRR